ncbi:MAG TPA: hypothetical protein PKE69_08970 [Pyrinomonadaceae bacterium]|nr:hypothetical protein [Pyrinomonadaceae bacterium]
MLQELKTKLREIPFLRGAYLRLKRGLTNELVGMTSRFEQDYFAEYGEKIYVGKGEIVDLGCWLGSTTIPLVKGLLKNPAFVGSGRKVFAYDLFVWFEWMNDSTFGTDLAQKYREGDIFVEEFKLRTKDFAEHIEICAGDLREIGWTGASIEFLLIDAMKDWSLANAIVRDFYPSLVPNESVVLHQDFAHFFTPCIHLVQWLFRENFEFANEVANSPSVIFKYTSKIDGELLQKTYGYDSFSDEDVNAAFEYSMSLVSDEKLPNVAAAKVMWFLHQGKREQAKTVFENLLESGVRLEKDLINVKELLEKN